MQNKTILVTGGAGYIGSHTVKELLKTGLRLVVYDNLSSGHKEAVSRCDLIVGDLADKNLLDKTFKKYKPQAVMHFAAFIEVNESVKNPGKYFLNNVCNGINLLEMMVANNVGYLIYSSSAAVYGEPQNIPILETDPTIPTNPYGLSKLIFEQILDTYDTAYNLKTISLRYFNAGGASLDGEIGDDHKNKTHLIASLILTALGQRDKFELYGTDYPTPDGTCIRDHIHVVDLADAHVKALEYLEKENKSDVFNLGNGKGFSNREVIEAVKKITGVDFPVIEKTKREGDPAQLIASSEKAQKVLGWKPKYNNLKVIVESAWRWHKSYPKGFQG